MRTRGHKATSRDEMDGETRTQGQTDKKAQIDTVRKRLN